MSAFLMFAVWAVAFSVGFGWLSWPWLGLCFVFGYLRGILFAGSRVPGGDFSTLGDRELYNTSKVVNLAALLTIIPVAIWWVIGWVVGYFVH